MDNKASCGRVSRQVKIGAVLTYALIILNALYGVFVTPYLISSLGDVEYGVYKTISSSTASLMVLDLGLGGTILRYISKYRATHTEHKIPNFLAMMAIQSAIACSLLLVAGMVMFFALDTMYAQTFTGEQLAKAKVLFLLLLCNMLLHIVQNFVNGVIAGHNKFFFANGIKLVRLLTRVAAIISLVAVFKNSIVIAVIDLALTVVFLALEVLYLFFKLKVKIKLSCWDKALFLESGKYTLMMLLTSFAAQANNNLDNVIIGSMSGPEFVTVYSIGLLIFTMYENLSTAISGVMLPSVSDLLESENAHAKVKDLIVKVGRIQFMLLGAAVVGFACIGKNFINLWVGPGCEDAYIITLILMIPSLFELCVNVCLTVLRAKNMLTFRTLVLFGSTILNLIISVVAINLWSYMGAALGTAASFIIGSLIIMNIYYRKKLRFPMMRIYLRIVNRTWICLLVSGAVLFASSRFLSGGILKFILNVIIFCVVYAVTLLLFGLTKEEKKNIPIINKLFGKRRKI